jgi:SAM-dependent methyltransferase
MNLLQYPPDYVRSHPMNESLQYFFSEYAKQDPATRSVLEIGTRRWGSKPTHHRELLEPCAKFTMSDFMDGEDVDVVSDAHSLASVFGENRFDVVWASSVWEHLKDPWLAAQEVLRVLRPGGLFFIQTHQAFPIHGYPDFYFLFSDTALKHLFKDAKKTVAAYEFPCSITPRDQAVEWNPAAPSFLNVCVSGAK